MSSGAPGIHGKALLNDDSVRIFFDGTFTEPQLNHPECVAIDADGNVWCGGERGEIFRIDDEGRHIEQVASTGGFALGMAFDSHSNLYVCDLKHACVFRLNTKTRQLVRFADGDGQGRKMAIPNFPVVDEVHGYLYVSDSHDSESAGPGIWRFHLGTGQGQMWYDLPLQFANGMAMSLSGDALYVAETFAQQISRIPIQEDGHRGEKEVLVSLPAYPDGLVIDRYGRLYILCYEPSVVYRFSVDEGLKIVYHDVTAHILCHPTNAAFRGSDLMIANLGRWHITQFVNVL